MIDKYNDWQVPIDYRLDKYLLHQSFQLPFGNLFHSSWKPVGGLEHLLFSPIVGMIIQSD